MDLLSHHLWIKYRINLYPHITILSLSLSLAIEVLNSLNSPFSLPSRAHFQTCHLPSIKRAILSKNNSERPMIRSLSKLCFLSTPSPHRKKTSILPRTGVKSVRPISRATKGQRSSLLSHATALNRL